VSPLHPVADEPGDVIVIGAGITGCIAACLLHDRGLRVQLVDQRGAPMRAASRWNEGKLHLGYTYTGTESLDTAALMLQGAGSFDRILTAVCGEGIEPAWWSRPVVYIVDPASIYTADDLWRRAGAVTRLLHEAASREEGLNTFLDPTLERLGIAEARALTGQERIAGAWRTGERAVSPAPIAARLTEAIARRGIEVLEATATSIGRDNGSWAVACSTGQRLHGAAVVNSSWESRARLDRPLHRTGEPGSIRYKVALFGSRLPGWNALHPSTRILGAFGDVTPYADGDTYLSWYPVGLLADSRDGSIPAVPGPLPDAALIAATLAGLGVHANGQKWTVAGGYVVAQGKGDITDRASSLHERHGPDARRLGPRYVSVDTGKYTLGPLLAERAVHTLLSSWSES
jgi:choline dehydrogenase-like flavoprotein